MVIGRHGKNYVANVYNLANLLDHYFGYNYTPSLLEHIIFTYFLFILQIFKNL